MLALEPLIKARIADITGLRGVYGLPDLRAERTKPAPCAYVIFDGYQPIRETREGSVQEVNLRWLIILAVRNLSGADNGDAARAEADPLIHSLLGRLLGWRPDNQHTPLKLAAAPFPEFEAGTLWLPLAFGSLTTLRGD